MKPKNTTKPTKPDGFPLFPHRNGQWAKKIRGKMWYFGPWKDPDAAVARLDREFDLINAGVNPGLHGASGASERYSVREVVGLFLDSKARAAKSGELSPRTLHDYHLTARRVVAFFGAAVVEDLTPGDFQRLRDSLPGGWSLKSVANEIRQARMIFKYAAEEQLIGQPLNFGSAFREPRRDALRKKAIAKKREHGLLMFEAGEVRQILAASDQTWRAMVLLAMNCGYGNTDLSELPVSVIDLDAGWIDYERSKTATERRCKLWPETSEAVKAVQAKRRQPQSDEDSDILFLTKYGNRYVRQSSNGTFLNAISGQFGKTLRSQGLKRLGLNFYSLRRTFATVGAETGLQVAVNFIMGHVDGSIPGVYRQRVSDDQIEAVTDHVHGWLFG